MKISPLAKALGAEISGVDVRSLTSDAFEAIYQAWLEYGVLRIRQQQLDDDSLMAFSERFGPLERIPLGKLSGPELDAKLEALGLANAYVTAISNIVENGRALGGLGNSEAEWHSDMTYVETPPTASILYAVEIPDEGGDTHFASQTHALASLPPGLRARIEGLSIKHDAAHTSVGSLRPGHEEVASSVDSPGAVHPIVRTHPETGSQALYLGRRDWAYVVGLSLEESEALLDEIWAHAALPEHCFTQRWALGDLILWDNRSVLHRRDAFPEQARRMMRRCQVLARDPAA